MDTWAKLDPTVQGAILGGLIALIGTGVTLVLTALLTVAQLRHASREQEKDRQLQLKKDILLDAVDGFGESSRAIASLGNCDLTDAEISDQYSKAEAKGERAFAVANLSTVKAMSKIRILLGKSFMELMPGRLEMMRAKADLDLANAEVDRVLDEQKRLADLRQAALLANDQRQLEILGKAFEHVHSQFQPVSEARDRCFTTLMALRQNFSLECIRRQLSIRRDLNEFVSCVRSETGNETPAAVFARATEIDEAELFSSLKSVYSDVNNFVEANISNANKADPPQT